MQECVDDSTCMVAMFPIDIGTANQIASQAQQLTGKICEVSNINSKVQVAMFREYQLSRLC